MPHGENRVVVEVGSLLRSSTRWGWNKRMLSSNSGARLTIWDTTFTSSFPITFHFPPSEVSVMITIGSLMRSSSRRVERGRR